MSLRRIITIGTLLITAVFAAWIATFKVFDSDVWWHIKAGQVMWEMKGLIDIDPFAYTREGLPYLATHEWLAQVILAGAYAFGVNGVIVLRILLTLCIALTLLLIDRKRVWPNAFLVIAMLVVMRQGLIERPQLWSNLLFAASIVLLYRYNNTDGGQARRPAPLLLLIPLQILWVNLHGAASLLMFIPLLGLIVQEGWWVLMGNRPSRDLRWLLLMIPALLLSMLVSPNTFHNFTYLLLLLTDQTKEFIGEWSPHPWGRYLLQLGPFWLISIGALAWTRHRMIQAGMLLLAAGILSRLGSRHEALFLIAAMGVTLYELRHNPTWKTWIDRLMQRAFITILLSALLFLFLLWVNQPYQTLLTRKNLTGLGAFEPAKGAYEFVVRSGIRGHVLNNYGIGGYLLFRGAPERKVFLDGRNVDYGYDFLRDALAARYDVNAFRELEKRWNFTHAILEFASNREPGKPYDFSYLNTLSDWKLVYVDEWASVYIKDIPEHGELLKNSYALLTPQNLTEGTILETLTEQSASRIIQELARAANQDERGIAALLTLAKAQRATGNFDGALTEAKKAMERRPDRYEPYEINASIAAAREEWNEAAALYDAALERIEGLPITPPWARIADVYEKAGQYGKAQSARRRASEH